MRAYLIVLFLLAITRLSAQSEEEITLQYGVITTGGDIAGSGVVVSYSVGQLFYSSSQTTQALISEGVQQASVSQNQLNFESSTLIDHLAVYPNPMSETVYIDFSSSGIPLTYCLSDLHGRILERGKVVDGKTKITPMIQSGSYLLIISSADDIIKTFKILKQ
ncbi:MAG: T9SS type A sorting domain-containing protein [Leeuwenhoekiella sp.]